MFKLCWNGKIVYHVEAIRQMTADLSEVKTSWRRKTFDECRQSAPADVCVPYHYHVVTLNLNLSKRSPCKEILNPDPSKISVLKLEKRSVYKVEFVCTNWREGGLV